jgi:O-antigen/teichoic acid export membrane protein
MASPERSPGLRVRARLIARLSGRRTAMLFLSTRVVNGVLALAQVTLAARVLGAEAAGRFFLLWTASWIVATIMKFGVDAVLPRIVAESQRRGDGLGTRAALGLGLVVALAASPLLLLVLGLPLSVPVVLLLLGTAAPWAVAHLCAGLLKAHDRVALSGALLYVAWPGAATVAAIAYAVAGGRSWEGLATFTAAAGLAIAAAGVAVTGLVVGGAAVRGLVARHGAPSRLDPDFVGAASLTALSELIAWLPVVLSAVLGLSPAVSAAVFAATRVAGLVSWGYQAVVAVLTPQLAGALAERDMRRVRTLLARGALAGFALTTPLCLLTAIFAGPLLAWFDPRFGDYGAVLVALVVAREIDALAGPLGEALLVGRRTWTDSAILSAAILMGGLVAAATEQSLGATAAGLGGAAAFVVANAVRAAVIWNLLGRGWPAERFRPVMATGWTLAVAAGGCFVAAVTLADGGQAVGAAICGSACSVFALLLLGSATIGLRRTLLSPVGIVCGVLLAHCVARPLSLALDPRSATPGLLSLGFSLGDVARAASIGGGGLLAFGLGVLGALIRGSTESPARPLPIPSARLVRNAVVVGGIGALAWLVLFARLGGPAALASDPAAIHLGQFGGAYGTVGTMLCFGVGLAGLARWAGAGERLGVAVAAGGFALGVLASVALASRGPLIASVGAAVWVVLAYRRPSRRIMVVGALLALLLASGLALLRTTREYAQVVPLRAAVSSTFETPPSRMATAELVEFDHLVAVVQLVPGTLPWLDGRSLRDVPAAFLPRALWPSKPLPLDFEISQVLYGPGTVTGTPFMLSGELYWNFGPWGVLAMFLLGLSWGALWRLLVRRLTSTTALVAGTMFAYSYLILTRPLGAMLLTTGMAVAGVVAAGWACSLDRPLEGLAQMWASPRWATWALRLQALVPPQSDLRQPQR